MKRTIRDQSLIVAVAAVVFFSNLGAPRLWDRDEPRNAGCAVEMLQRGDWVVPMFNAELRTHKPVLLYWLMMTAYEVFGVNEFAARFWSALLGIGTALATYHIGRRLFHAEVGLWGGLILATSLMFVVASRAATPDSVLIFFSTMPILVYVLSTFKPRTSDEAADAVLELKEPGRYFPASWPVACLMYGLMGVAILAKGPVGLVLPTAVIGMFLLIVRLPDVSDQVPASNPSLRRIGPLLSMLRPFAPLHFLRTCLVMRPLTAVAVALAVALPWYIWVGLRTDGAWLQGFFLEHNVGRAMNSMEGHGGGPWYYPVAVIIGFFPWSLLLTPMIIGLVSRIRHGDPWRLGYLLLACWVGVYIGLFTLAGTKLPSYVTPMYPALAMATACFVFHWTRGSAVARASWTRSAMITLSLVGLVMLVAVPIAAGRFLPGEEWLGAVGLVPLVGGAVGYLLLKNGRVPATARLFTATAVAFTTLLFGFVTVRVDRHREFDVLLETAQADGGAAQLSSFGCHEPSWVFYAGQPIYEYGRYEPGDAVAFLKAQEKGFVITTDARFETLRPILPADVDVLASTPYFLKKSNLVLVGRLPGRAQTAENSARPVVKRASFEESSRR